MHRRTIVVPISLSTRNKDEELVKWRTLLTVFLVVSLFGCSNYTPREWQQEDNYRWSELNVPSRGSDGFVLLSPSETGVTFSNSVTDDQARENEHLFNGSGVALGDVDGDGLVDIYLASLDGPNVLYRNLGNWRFEDITESAGVAAPGRFATGAVFADVDGDGDLDLLVTAMEGASAYYRNNGMGVFEEKTEEVGLASELYGTTQALADVDGDGDLDLYVGNNKVKPARDIYPPNEILFDNVVEAVMTRTAAGVDTSYVVRPEFRDHYVTVRQLGRIMRFENAEPDKFYLNDGSGIFEEIPFTNGRFLDEDGEPLSETPLDWALTARFHDIDNDGDPDLYVCNDFESPDRMWINDGAGRFQLIERTALRATSNATMTMDFSDIDRDGDEDFILIDMLDQRTRQQKTQLQAMVPAPAMLGQIDNRPQLGRNTLLANRGDGTFAEVAHFAGVEASGWSWSVLFLDVDLDGYEDILIGNGHRHDFLDSDTQARIRNTSDTTDWRNWRFLYPRLDLRNVAFRNRGDLTFEFMTDAWGIAPEADVSHGAASADLDNDGDLDVVFNRFGSPAALFRNESIRPRIAVRLRGLAPNTQGIGAKVSLLGGAVPEQRDEITAGGLYNSGADPQLMFAAGDADTMTIVVEWRSGKVSLLGGVLPNRVYELDEAGAVDPMEIVDPRQFGRNQLDEVPIFSDVSAMLQHRHVEQQYSDFSRQPLLRHKLSQLGPGMTWADYDNDGDDDLLVGTGKGGTLALLRNEGSRFVRVRLSRSPAEYDMTTILPVPGTTGGFSILAGQMNYEALNPTAASNASSVIRMDLSRGTLNSNTPRVTIEEAVSGARSSVGPMALSDYDGDGDLDLFVGGRVLPAAYPNPASSRLFKNERGEFILDEAASESFSEIGMVSSAVFSDTDADGDPDLLLAVEWDSPKLFRNNSGLFEDVTELSGFASYQSMWNGITTGDFNSDGMMDVVVTSWGQNTRLDATNDHPLLIYYGDFEGNGTMDILEARYEPQLRAIAPIRGRHHVAPAIPFVARRIGSSAEYADASINDVLGPALQNATSVQVNTFDHMLFLNVGGVFEAEPLPMETQLSPSFYAGVADFDGDGNEDLFLTQNFYPVEPEMPRYAAGRGLLLLGDGTGRLFALPSDRSGIKVYGDQRGAAIADFNRDGRVDLAVSQNGNSTKLFRNENGVPGVRVILRGPPSNPKAVGAVVRLVYGDTMGPAREIHAGSGFWSHDGLVPVMGKSDTPTAIWVRWPGGATSTTAIVGETEEVTISIDSSN